MVPALGLEAVYLAKAAKIGPGYRVTEPAAAPAAAGTTGHTVCVFVGSLRVFLQCTTRRDLNVTLTRSKGLLPPLSWRKCYP